MYEIDLRGRGRSSSVPASSVKVTCNRGTRRPNVNLSGYGDNSVHPARRDLLRPSPSTLRNFSVQIAESRVFPSSLSSFPRNRGLRTLANDASNTSLLYHSSSFGEAEFLAGEGPLTNDSDSTTINSHHATKSDCYISSQPHIIFPTTVRFYFFQLDLHRLGSYINGTFTPSRRISPRNSPCQALLRHNIHLHALLHALYPPHLQARLPLRLGSDQMSRV